MRSRLTTLRARIVAAPLESWITAAVVVGAVAFTFAQLHPNLIFRNTTPTGGDMGAHVWSGTYLRDHLLTHGRLSGWTPDWYAGAPAFHFYMVVPFLLILLLDVLLPYAVAFKLVAVSGVVLLPAAAWAFGKLSGLRFPGPPMLAAATVFFLFDTRFTIYGGNIASTMAGEFAFAISLSLSLVYLGVVARGLRTGKHRALAAVLLALVGLCHLIPAFFAIAGTLVLLALNARRSSLRWLVTTVPVAALLGAFWALPFVWRRDYMNDMGWEKIQPWSNYPLWSTDWWGRVGDSLWPWDLRVAWLLALVGIVGGIAGRKRPHLFLGIMTALAGVAFVLLPQSRLWNARLLPFYYLGIYLLAALGIVEIVRSLVLRFADSRPVVAQNVLRAVPVAGVLLALVWAGLALRTMPFGHTDAQNRYHWMGLTASDDNFVDGWARWNFAGYEARTPTVDGGGYHEYRDLIETMKEVGAEHGCGRAMWEYEPELVRYGTPMALMLLPHWTNGCIGSMEGLYFESSATTPFHFLNQSELSAVPSRAQRDLPYGPLDVSSGGRAPPAAGREVLPDDVGDGPGPGRGRRRPHRGGLVRAVDGVRGGGRRAGVPPGQPARRPDRRGRRAGRVAGAGGRLVPRRRRPRCVPGRRRPAGVAPGDGGGGPPGRSGRTGRGHRHRGGRRPHQLRRRRDRPAGARPGLLLPELGDVRGPGPVPGRPQPHGRDPDREPRRVALRLDAGRPSGLAAHLPGHRRGRPARSPPAGGRPRPARAGGHVGVRPGPRRRRAGPRGRGGRRRTGRARRRGRARRGPGGRGGLMRRLGPGAAVVLATGVDVGGLLVIRAVTGWPVAVADAIALLVAAPVSYLLHRRADRGADPFVRWARDPRRFGRVAFVAGLADLAVLQILVVAVGDPSLLTLFGLKLVALTVAALVRVVGHRRILVRTVRADQAEPVARPAAPGDRRLSVILPSYHQPDVVGEAVIRVREVLVAALGADEIEVVVVDDGSGDDTAARAEAAGADQVVVHPENRGKGAAVRSGAAVARGRTIAFTDADLAYDPAHLLVLLDRVEAGWDVAVGSRRHTDTVTLVRARRLREFGGRFINVLTQAVLLGHYRDTQCGLKGFRSDVAPLVLGQGLIDGFAFDIELFHLVERNGLSLTEVPVQVANSDQSSVQVLRDGTRLVRDLFRIRRNAAAGRYRSDGAVTEPGAPGPRSVG